jgi:hypothetical protein
VTIRIGEMDHELVMQALQNGLVEADRLKARGIIHEALIVIKEKMVTTMGGGNNITLEVERGN